MLCRRCYKFWFNPESLQDVIDDRILSIRMVLSPRKIEQQKILLYEAFHNKLRNWNPLEKEYLDYEKLTCSGLTTESSRWKWDSLKYLILEQRTITTWRICGSREKRSRSKTFRAGTKKGTLFQHWRLCRKWLSFITAKLLKCSSLDVLYIT